MQITSEFTTAVHILTCIDVFEKDMRVTSEVLAGSTGVNAVIIRNVLSQLKAAGIVSTRQGSGGAHLSKPLDEVTLYDIYKAVDCVDDDGLFHFHENPNVKCPVGRNIHKTAVYACLNFGEAYVPDDIRKQSICINGDISVTVKPSAPHKKASLLGSNIQAGA